MRNFSFWKNKTFKKPLITIALFGIVFLLSACSGVRQAGSWPAITATESHVYIAFSNDVISLDVANQSEAWRFQGEGAVEFYSPPLVVPEEDTVYLADFGRAGSLLSGGGLIVSMYALEDGGTNPPNTRWIKEDVTDGRIVAGLHLDGDVIYTGSSNNRIVAVSRSAGDVIWETATENAVWSAPSQLDDIVYVTSIDRNIYALNAADGTAKWTHTLNGAGAGSAVVSADGDLVYAGSFGGEVIALNAADGSDVWKASAADWVWGAPVEINGIIVYGDNSGNVYAVDAKTGDPLWDATVNESITGDIVVSGDTILVASGDDETLVGHVTAFSTSGEKLWDRQTFAYVSSSPAVLGESNQVAVVYGSIDNDIPLGVQILEVADGSVNWTWNYTEVE